MKPLDDEDWFACSHCGQQLPASAQFCRYCGADERVGWENDEIGDLEDGFDYDDFVRREFPEQHRDTSPAGRRGFRTVVIVLLCIALLWLALSF